MCNDGEPIPPGQSAQSQQASQLAKYALAVIAKHEHDVVGPRYQAVEPAVRRCMHEVRTIADLVAGGENTLLLLAQVAEEGGIQMQRMIAVILDVLLLERHAGIVIIEKDGVAILQYRNALAVDPRGVEHESRPCRTGHLNNLGSVVAVDFAAL